jgi:hypothetical protein
LDSTRWCACGSSTTGNSRSKRDDGYPCRQCIFSRPRIEGRLLSLEGDLPTRFSPGERKAFRQLKKAALKTLSNRLALTSKVALDDKGRCIDVRSAVVSSVSDDCLTASLNDVGRGDGGELRHPKSGRPPSFHSAYSSCALAINSFAPWRLDSSGLTIDGRTGFRSLEFESKFPINPNWKRAPNVDVVGVSSQELVAIESKLTEHFDLHTAEFSQRYSKVVESIAHSSWAEQYEQLRRKPDRYAFFNAAQIIKHYLGLRADTDGRVAGRAVTLLYLYWEPSDASNYTLFSYHRAAVSEFSEGLCDESIRFNAMSYPELWRQWIVGGAGTAHLKQLNARYSVELGTETPAVARRAK